MTEEIEPGVLRRLITATHDPVVLVDAAGRISSASVAAEQLFGYEPDELLDQPVERLIPESLRAQHEASRAAYARRPESRAMRSRGTLKALCADGAEIPVTISLTPLKTGEGLMVLAAIEPLATVSDVAYMADQLEAARQLQDAVLQRLFGTAASLSALLRRLEADTHLAERLREVIDVLDGTIGELRVELESDSTRKPR